MLNRPVSAQSHYQKSSKRKDQCRLNFKYCALKIFKGLYKVIMNCSALGWWRWWGDGCGSDAGDGSGLDYISVSFQTFPTLSHEESNGGR